MDLSFLRSTRFYVMLIGVFAIYAFNKGLIGDAEVKLIESIAAIFIGIKTWDRTVDTLSNRTDQ